MFKGNAGEGAPVISEDMAQNGVTGDGAQQGITTDASSRHIYEIKAL